MVWETKICSICNATATEEHVFERKHLQLTHEKMQAGPKKRPRVEIESGTNILNIHELQKTEKLLKFEERTSSPMEGTEQSLSYARTYEALPLLHKIPALQQRLLGEDAEGPNAAIRRDIIDERWRRGGLRTLCQIAGAMEFKLITKYNYQVTFRKIKPPDAPSPELLAMISAMKELYKTPWRILLAGIQSCEYTVHEGRQRIVGTVLHSYNGGDR